MNHTEQEAGRWLEGPLPPNVRLGIDSIITGHRPFTRFLSTLTDALVIGAHCSMHGVHFALGRQARTSIGDWCCFAGAILLCEEEIRIGSYVALGMHVAVADTDFHPIAPAQRLADAVACSPLGQGRARPPVVSAPVVIEDDVWVGPNTTILKGVRIGAGSVIEPGSLLTHSVPARSRVIGNPARIVGEV